MERDSVSRMSGSWLTVRQAGSGGHGGHKVEHRLLVVDRQSGMIHLGWDAVCEVAGMGEGAYALGRVGWCHRTS